MAKLSKSRHPEGPPAPAVEPGPRLAQRPVASRRISGCGPFAFFLASESVPSRSKFVAETAKRGRPEMAPQPIEKIESAPGNGRSRKPRSHKIWYTAATADRSARAESRKTAKVDEFDARGNFPPRNPLKSLETGKESRNLAARDSPTPHPAELRTSTFPREGGRGSGRPVNTRPPTGSTCPRASGRRRR